MFGENWNSALAPDQEWRAAYGKVEGAVKAFFSASTEHTTWGGRPRTTDELVQVLYPVAMARGAGITARKRIYTALRALAKHGLKDYCEPGPQRKLKHTGKLVTPLIWRAPPAAAPIQRHTLVAIIHDEVQTVLDPEGYWVKWDDVKDRLK